MEIKAEDESLIRRYLLGTLSQAELRQIEERIMTDEDFFHEVILQEEELIEDYICGSLSEKDSEKVRKFSLSGHYDPQEIRFVEDLRSFAQHQPPIKSSSQSKKLPQLQSWLNFSRSNFRLISFSLVASILLLLVIISWLMARVLLLDAQLERARAEQSGEQDRTESRQLEELQAENRELAEKLQQEQERSAELEREMAASVQNPMANN